MITYYQPEEIKVEIRPCVTCGEELTYENGRLIDWDHQDECPNRRTN